MSTNDIDKAYVSPYDKFLYGYDASHNKSESQLKEIKKHERIAMLRDNKDYQAEAGEIWEDF